MRALMMRSLASADHSLLNQSDPKLSNPDKSSLKRERLAKKVNARREKWLKEIA